MQMDQLFYLALQTVIPILAAFVAKEFIKFLRLKMGELETTVGKSNFEALNNFAQLSVQAAQQSGLAGIIKNVGAEKKAWALGMLQELLNKNGLGGIDVKTLDAAIEAAYWREMGDAKPTPAG